MILLHFSSRLQASEDIPILFVKLSAIAGDRVLELISLPIVKYPLFIPPLSRGAKGGVRQRPRRPRKHSGE
jgi:hypothetical protein